MSVPLQCDMPDYERRRMFIALASVLFAGCSSNKPRTTTECAVITDAAAQVECMQQIVFPQVVEGVAWGALAGAVLGGVVAFALTRDPRKIVVGFGVGGIVGGVAGGVVAYYKRKMELASNNVALAANEAYQDSVADERKLTRLVSAYERAADDVQNDVGKGSAGSQPTAKAKTLGASAAAATTSMKDTAAVYEALPEVFERESGVSGGDGYRNSLQGMAGKAERINALLARLERVAARLDTLSKAK